MFCLEEYILKLNNKKNKKINFNKYVSVILIPNINEYKECNLNQSLWWTKEELQSFKLSCSEEIFKLIKRHNLMTVQQAAKLLYQPGSMTITYDTENFIE